MLMLSNRHFFISVIDFFIITLFIFFVFNFRLLYFRRVTLLISLFCLLSLSLSIIYSEVGPYEKIGAIGPELRGVILWLMTLLVLVKVFDKNILEINKFIILITLFFFIRLNYDLIYSVKSSFFADEYFSDAGNLLFSATFSVFIFSLLIFKKKGSVHLSFKYLILIFIFFSFLTLIGNRRASLLVLMGGIFIVLLLYILRSDKRSKPSLIRKFSVILVTISVISYLPYFDMIYLNGKYTERIMSVTDFDAKEQTSNYEHITDILEATEVIKSNFFFGAGIGTFIPNRTLNKYHELAPIHSPHLHTWVRLGLIGFISYFLLMVFSIYKAFTIRFFSTFDIYKLSASISLLSYLLLQVAFPPFYIDSKQGLLVAFLTAIILKKKS